MTSMTLVTARSMAVPMPDSRMARASWLRAGAWVEPEPGAMPSLTLWASSAEVGKGKTWNTAHSSPAPTPANISTASSRFHQGRGPHRISNSSGGAHMGRVVKWAAVAAATSTPAAGASHHQRRTAAVASSEAGSRKKMRGSTPYRREALSRGPQQATRKPAPKPTPRPPPMRPRP
jgi:hypothetical protein